MNYNGEVRTVACVAALEHRNHGTLGYYSRFWAYFGTIVHSST
jgi:hypothetical protein